MEKLSVSSAFRCAQQENKMHVLTLTNDIDLDLDYLIWLYRSIPIATVCKSV